MAVSPRSAPALERSRRRYAWHSHIGIAAVASPGAASASARAITFVTGHTGGPTTLSNLALLCRRHHRAVHEQGYGLERPPDGELRFRRPDGRILPESP